MHPKDFHDRRQHEKSPERKAHGARPRSPPACSAQRDPERESSSDTCAGAHRGGSLGHPSG
ncbi:hypothetical protein BQ8420_27130 [Nocardiopsis sp. JB363]|nr:hypothetical protein BQ8420_27130 [Nocardiopsis sp. JB363]